MIGAPTTRSARTRTSAPGTRGPATIPGLPSGPSRRANVVTQADDDLHGRAARAWSGARRRASAVRAAGTAGDTDLVGPAALDGVAVRPQEREDADGEQHERRDGRDPLPERREERGRQGRRRRRTPPCRPGRPGRCRSPAIRTAAAVVLVCVARRSTPVLILSHGARAARAQPLGEHVVGELGDGPGSGRASAIRARRRRVVEQRLEGRGHLARRRRAGARRARSRRRRRPRPPRPSRRRPGARRTPRPRRTRCRSPPARARPTGCGRPW